jgi:drug/metabolite transporter (DMT)-like permease
MSSGMTGLLDAAEPLLILLFSAVAARRMPVRRVIVAAICGAFGVVLLALGSGPESGDVKGITLVLVSAAFWAAYCIAVPRLIIARGALPVTVATMLMGALPMVMAGAPGIPSTIHLLTAPEIIVLVALIIGSSTLALLFWNIGSAGIGAVQAGWFLYMIPLISLLGGAVLLGEPITLLDLFGGAIILLSVILAQPRTA